MEESENKDTNVKATIDAVAGLVAAIPIYQDTVQPAAKEVGKSLEVVAKAVNIGLAPISILVWGYSQIANYITTRVTEKLKNVPPENIVSPPTSIAGPAIESLRFCGDESDLRELYANLLASSMDIDTQHLIHPGYVEILKNLCSDEALLLQLFISTSTHPLINISQSFPDSSGEVPVMNNFSHFKNLGNFKRPDLIPSYIDNICRLGLTEVPSDLYLSSPNVYDSLESDELIKYAKERIEKIGNSIKISKKVIRITSYGQQFIHNVVMGKN